MPTARELLEQADALMRRNRARDAIAREQAHAESAPASVAAVVPVAAPLPEIPVLTDAVRDAMPERAVAVTAAPARAAHDAPVLTEVVADLESMPLVAEAEQGEPSFWIDAPDEDQSVLGVAPDSVAVVPPADPVAPTRASMPDAVATPALIEPVAPLATAVALDLPAPTFVAPSYPLPPPPEAKAAEPEPEPEPTLESEPAFEDELAIVEQGAPEDAEPIAPQFIGAGPPLVPAVAEGVRSAGPEGDERWRQLAEDIRMQVLQRIDMFTDTGLHEQLGERLKPIVDRASADLVATINQHVGELLRSYVAEAIEREIERWRHDGER
jgi:hypothetical protein